MDKHRNGDINTNRFACLTRFTRHRNGRQQEDQAVESPAHVKCNNTWVNTVVVMREGADNPRNHADTKQNGNHQMGPNNPEIKIPDVQQSALVGHVKFAAFREEHGDNRWQNQMERQHQIVDFTPEAVTVAPVHARVDVNREEQMR